MDFPDDLRFAEDSLKQTEDEFLAGNDGIAEALLDKLSTGPFSSDVQTFSSDVQTAREQMQNLDEFRYVKWNRWDRNYEFSASFWKDEGYPSIDSTTLRASNPDWYSKRTGTTTFVKDLVFHRNIAMVNETDLLPLSVIHQTDGCLILLCFPVYVYLSRIIGSSWYEIL
ncbi:MAG: hypothetical protein ACXABN_19320 [Candidatus Thorarchaeota archaeon]|jgi:hypothetical protein